MSIAIFLALNHFIDVNSVLHTLREIHLKTLNRFRDYNLITFGRRASIGG